MNRVLNKRTLGGVPFRSARPIPTRTAVHSLNFDAWEYSAKQRQVSSEQDTSSEQQRTASVRSTNINPHSPKPKQVFPEQGTSRKEEQPLAPIRRTNLDSECDFPRQPNQQVSLEDDNDTSSEERRRQIKDIFRTLNTRLKRSPRPHFPSFPPSSTAPAYPVSPVDGSGGHVPRLHNKVALITGASSGLGRAIALAYAAHGAKLVVCADLWPEPRGGGVEEEGDWDAAVPTDELIEKRFGRGKAAFVKCDVGVAAEVEGAVEVAVELGGGRLDIIVNNAGLGTTDRWIRVHDLDENEFDRVMNVNVRGVYLGCKYACTQFLRQGLDATGRRGWIVNVASMLGYVGIKGGAAAYCASKGAVLNMTKQIALDYAPDKIHCNALCPGFTKTSMTRVNFTNAEVNAEMIGTTPWGAWGNVTDVAKGAVFLASDDAAWVTGIGLPVDGGYLAQ